MDYYECESCGNIWPDYEPKACPFCFNDELHPIGVGAEEPEIVSEKPEELWMQS